MPAKTQTQAEGESCGDGDKGWREAAMELEAGRGKEASLLGRVTLPTPWGAASGEQ